MAIVFIELSSVSLFFNLTVVVGDWVVVICDEVVFTFDEVVVIFDEVVFTFDEVVVIFDEVVFTFDEVAGAVTIGESQKLQKSLYLGNDSSLKRTQCFSTLLLGFRSQEILIFNNEPFKEANCSFEFT